MRGAACALALTLAVGPGLGAGGIWSDDDDGSASSKAPAPAPALLAFLSAPAFFSMIWYIDESVFSSRITASAFIEIIPTASLVGVDYGLMAWQVTLSYDASLLSLSSYGVDAIWSDATTTEEAGSSSVIPEADPDATHTCRNAVAVGIHPTACNSREKT